MKTILIIVIALAAYATGAVSARRLSHSSAAAHPWQLLVLCLALAGLAYLRPSGPAPQVFGISFVIMFFLGWAACALTAGRRDPVVGGTREYEDVRQERSVTLWRRWLNLSRAVIDYEFRLLLLAVYFLIIGPVAIAFRFLRKRDSTAGLGSAWIPKTDSPTLNSSRRAF